MSDTQSVLDMMTQGIMGRKQDKATGLTPVGTEADPALTAPTKPPISGVQSSDFPYGAGIQNQIDHSARVIRNELSQIEACLQAIERTIGTPEGGYPAVVSAVQQAVTTELTSQQKAETAADAAAKAFQKDWKAKQDAAQAQAFADLDDEPGDEPPRIEERITVSTGWECPVHGHSNIQTLTSRKGRTYRACAACSAFEKGD